MSAFCISDIYMYTLYIYNIYLYIYIYIERERESERERACPPPLACNAGKHIDKINDRTAHGLGTLPALLGEPAACALAAVALVGQHVATILLVYTRLFPPGALLAPLMCAAYELPKALSVLAVGRPEAKPPASLTFTGSMGVSLRPGRTWPLWFATSAGWHAVTFGYWLLAGLLLSWAARPFSFKLEAAALAVACAAQAARYILGAAERRR